MYRLKAIPAMVIGFVSALIFTIPVVFLFLKLYESAVSGLISNVIVLSSLITIFSVFALSGVWLILYCQELLLEEEEISVFSLGKKYSIKFKEAEYFEDGSGNSIVGNSRRRIAFPSFQYLSGKDKEEAFLFLMNKMRENNIEYRTSLRAILPFRKGF